MTQLVAIQGIRGSYHHQVAQSYFGTAVQVLECMSFGTLVHSLEQQQCTDAVMAIENSIAGSILPNYAYIDEFDLKIIGEYYLPIHHCLMAMPGQEISDIKEVHSHPMALLQCKEFFRKHAHIRLVEAPDTAAVAKQISEQQSQRIAAIAGREAAAIYDLGVLAEDIQTIKTNSTRFFVLGNQKNKSFSEKAVDKASLKFVLDHKRGSLATILNVMSDCQLNLTKIQSLPVIDQPWKYAFFVDVTFQEYDNYTKAKSLLEIMATEFKVLGAYKNQKK